MFVPNRFLLRLEYAAPYAPGVPAEDADELIDLPDSAALDPLAALDGAKPFAELRLGWNETGLALVLTVKGKDRPPAGDAARPFASDGLSVWVDTRGDRTAHRAGRHCHLFHLLPAGGGPDRDEPVVVQSKIHRATDDAPLHPASAVPFRAAVRGGGYRLEAFLPAGVLNGFDPDQNPRLGFCYAVRDAELGEQLLAPSAEFPYAEDPSLWATVRLARG